MGRNVRIAVGALFALVDLCEKLSNNVLAAVKGGVVLASLFTGRRVELEVGIDRVTHLSIDALDKLGNGLVRLLLLVMKVDSSAVAVVLGQSAVVFVLTRTQSGPVAQQLGSRQTARVLEKQVISGLHHPVLQVLQRARKLDKCFIPYTEAVAIEACPAQHLVHVRHEERVVDRGWEANVAKVTWALK